MERVILEGDVDELLVAEILDHLRARPGSGCRRIEPWPTAHVLRAKPGNAVGATERRSPGQAKVHGRRADEAGDKEVRRLFVEMNGRPDLLQDAVFITAIRSAIVIASTWSCVT